MRLENFLSNEITDPTDIPEDIGLDTEDSAASPGDGAGESSDVSSGDTNTGDTVSGSDVSGGDSNTVSGGDVPSEKDSVLGQTVYVVPDSVDYTDVLTHIDYTLTAILFLILFIWCAHHIRNAVRSFTGRGIDK